MSLYPTDREDVTALMEEASLALSQKLPPPKDGFKTGTTTWPVPDPLHWGVGDLSVIVNGKGEPVAVMKTLSLVACKFKDVTEEFALSEYEGTWEDYIEGHRRFFQRQGKGHFDDDTVVLTERFEIIYQRASQG